MTNDDAILQRLDLIVATLKLAYSHEIAKAREQTRADPVAASILDLTAEDWVPSGKLQEGVAKQCGVTARTVRRKLQDLISLGALQQIGSSRSTAYRSAGLI